MDIVDIVIHLIDGLVHDMLEKYELSHLMRQQRELLILQLIGLEILQSVRIHVNEQSQAEFM